MNAEKLALWTAAHQHQQQSMLTFAAGSEICSLFQCSPQPGDRVLDVGIGGGQMARYLLELGATPISVDCVPEAFACLPDKVEHHLISELASIPPLRCHYGICHLVAQHCDDAELRELLVGIRPHVDMLYIQYAATPETRQRMTSSIQHERSYQEFSTLAKACGYERVEIHMIRFFHHSITKYQDDHQWMYVRAFPAPTP